MRKKRGKTLNREKIIDYELQIEIFFEEYILSLHIPIFQFLVNCVLLYIIIIRVFI